MNERKNDYILKIKAEIEKEKKKIVAVKEKEISEEDDEILHCPKEENCADDEPNVLQNPNRNILKYPLNNQSDFACHGSTNNSDDESPFIKATKGFYQEQFEIFLEKTTFTEYVKIKFYLYKNP